jgi:hypothetical protein
MPTGSSLPRPHGTSWWIAVLMAPTFLVCGLLIWLVIDRLYSVGPFDRSQITLAVAVPLCLLAPGAAAASRHTIGSSLSTRLTAVLAIAISTLLGTALLMSSSAGCPLGLQAAAAVAACAIGVGGSFALAVFAARKVSGQPAVAWGSAAAVWLLGMAASVLLLVALVPPLTCGPRF